jgi:Family of unknown function (DUF6527)
MTTLIHRFVTFIPDTLESGVIYVSLDFGTASHRCCCGCGREVVTPLAPAEWKLIFDGETISLYPSIGNWSFPCRSHYWIRNNQAKWVDDWTGDEVIVTPFHTQPDPANIAEPLGTKSRATRGTTNRGNGWRNRITKWWRAIISHRDPRR